MVLKEELRHFNKIVKEMDRKVIVIFLSVAILQTISWYVTSRNFFRINLFTSLQNDSNVHLYEYLYWFLGDFVTLFVLSAVIIKFILKENLTDYGLKVGDFKIGLFLSLTFFVVMLPLVWIFSGSPEFVEKYPQKQKTFLISVWLH